MVDGVIYVTSTWSRVYAFDAAGGALLVVLRSGESRRDRATLCCDVVNRGLAVWNGRVYFGTLDGRLIALDARNGKPAWVVNTIEDAARPTPSPVRHESSRVVIVIGNSGAGQWRARLRLRLRPARTASDVWRFFVVPNGPGDAPEERRRRQPR